MLADCYTYGMKSVSELSSLIILKALQVSSVPTVMTTPSAKVKMKPTIDRRSSINAKTEKLKRSIHDNK